MALRLRRGTDAERITITPLEGELIYTTDTGKVYIGDGTTAGGNLISTFEMSDLSDVSTAGISTGDILKWNGAAFVPGPESGGSGIVDGQTYFINIDGDVQGSVFAENSSVMVDSINRNMFATNIEALGSINADNGSVTASKIRVGGETPNQISLYDANDTNLIITTANTNGNVIIGRSLRIGGTSAGFGDTSLTMFNETQSATPINVNHSSDSANSVSLAVIKSRGSKASPSAVQSGDTLGSFLGIGYNGAANRASGGVTVVTNGAPEANRIPGRVALFTIASNGSPQEGFSVDETNKASFSGAAKLVVYADTTARDTAIATPEAGMTVFVTDGDGAGNAQFQGYDGTAWVALN